MEISLEDFNALSAERSRRDVQIAKLEMELQSNQRRHDEEVSALRSERNALWAENAALRQRADALQTAYENVRFENHWMKQYILLSVDRVQMFFAHIRNIEVLSAIKSFVLNVLPEDASAEQIAYTARVMDLPMRDEEARIVHVSGNYVDAHDNGNLNINSEQN